MMLRDERQVLLSGNRSSAFPSRVLYLDTETRTVDSPPHVAHFFRMAWTLYAKASTSKSKAIHDWKYWSDPEELCRYIDGLAPQGTTLVIYTHNAFFDCQVAKLHFFLPRWGWKYDFWYEAGLTYIFCITRGKAHIKIVSTTNYFDFSLSYLGQDVGLPKLDVDPLKESESKVKEYCRRDVEILEASMNKYAAFNREHDTGRFSMTKASQAFSCYRHRFMEKPIFLHHLAQAIDLERDAYFGGRVECFHLGQIEGGPFTALDVNSMYSGVMKANRFPSRLLHYSEPSTIEEIARYLGRACLIAEVSLATETPAYALRRDGKLVFPVGRFRTCLCSEGLRRAFQAQEIVAVHRLCVYQPDYLFGEYVDYWYPLKSHYKHVCNPLYTGIVKKMLNCLYGKFGQKKTVTRMLVDPQALSPVREYCMSTATGECWIELSGFGTRILYEGEENGEKSFVAIAAHVAEYARFALWDCMSRLGRERLLYVDTDSIVCRSEHLDRLDGLVHPERLGALSVDSIYSSLVLHGPKDYEADGNRVCKGVPTKATQIDEGTYEYTQFLGAVTHQNLGVDDCILTRPQLKRLARSYNKGIVRANGSIEPFRYEDF